MVSPTSPGVLACLLLSSHLSWELGATINTLIVAHVAANTTLFHLIKIVLRRGKFSMKESLASWGCLANCLFVPRVACPISTAAGEMCLYAYVSCSSDSFADFCNHTRQPRSQLLLFTSNCWMNRCMLRHDIKENGPASQSKTLVSLVVGCTGKLVFAVSSSVELW